MRILSAHPAVFPDAGLRLIIPNAFAHLLCSARGYARPKFCFFGNAIANRCALLFVALRTVFFKQVNKLGQE